MKFFYYVIMLLLTIFISAPAAVCVELETDQLMGKVTLGSKLAAGVKDLKAIVVIATKINKLQESGLVRIRGDFPGAQDADDYLEKSVFMARDVEQKIRPILSNRFQTYIMTSTFTNPRKNAPNSVEIFYYPRELKVEDMGSFYQITTQQNTLPKVTSVPEDQSKSAARASDSRSTALSEVDNLNIDTKISKNTQGAEDVALANELVSKAKARAAERARRLALESAPPQ